MDVPNYIEWKAREEVLEVVRSSLVPELWKFVLCTVLAVLPFFFLFPLWRQGTWGVVVFFVWLAVAGVFLGRTYFLWSRTVFVVTDRRVIDYDQRGLFHHVVTEARYEQMDEVSVQVRGVASTIFRYGTLRLQLSGSAADIQIEHVNQPTHLADRINDLRIQVSQTPNAGF